ncbi:Uncharacterised protein [Nocardia brasiliensis]|nr:Uncharacterised protein [Nocardia brasiliensis]
MAFPAMIFAAVQHLLFGGWGTMLYPLTEISD